MKKYLCSTILLLLVLFGCATAPRMTPKESSAIQNTYQEVVGANLYLVSEELGGLKKICFRNGLLDRNQADVLIDEALRRSDYKVDEVYRALEEKGYSPAYCTGFVRAMRSGAKNDLLMVIIKIVND